MKPHLRRPVWTKTFCPLRSYVGLNMHTVSCHSPFVVMDTDKGWVGVGVGAGGLGLKKGKENIICVHSNWVKFSAAKNGLDKSLFRDLRCVCAAGRGRRQPNRSYTTDTRLWQDLPLMKKKKEIHDSKHVTKCILGWLQPSALCSIRRRGFTAAIPCQWCVRENRPPPSENRARLPREASNPL